MIYFLYVFKAFLSFITSYQLWGLIDLPVCRVTSQIKHWYFNLPSYCFFLMLTIVWCNSSAVPNLCGLVAHQGRERGTRTCEERAGAPAHTTQLVRMVGQWACACAHSLTYANQAACTHMQPVHAKRAPCMCVQLARRSWALLLNRPQSSSGPHFEVAEWWC